jgi:hypothetical protein
MQVTARLALLVLLLDLRGLAFDLTGACERAVNFTCGICVSGYKASFVRVC